MWYFPALHFVSLRKEKKKKRNINNDLAILPSHDNDTFCYEVLEDVIHHGLEDGGAVGHTKEHYQRFEQVSIGPESCLPLISRLDVDVVETPTNI